MTIGTDITHVGRIRDMMLRHPQFIATVFTEQEVAYCEGKRNKYEHYAARFAAKESIMKAVGRGWLQGLEWRDIEVLHLPSGAPDIKAHGTLQKVMLEQKIASFAASLSHCREYAIAVVIAVRGEPCDVC